MLEQYAAELKAAKAQISKTSAAKEKGGLAFVVPDYVTSASVRCSSVRSGSARSCAVAVRRAPSCGLQ